MGFQNSFAVDDHDSLQYHFTRVELVGAGPAEWFAFVMLGLVVLAFSDNERFLRCLIAAGLGLLLSVIGMSVVSSFPRFAGGFTEL